MVVGIPVIAERSVPGDMLYPVKTNITEEVRASLTLSPYAKVQWETTRLERRVAEARLLASEGKLTPEVEASVAEAIQEHTDAAVLEIAMLREDNADEAALAEIAFASALAVQADVLADGQGDSNEETPEDGYSIATLATMLADASGEADVAQADTELSYETLLATVEMETTRAYELFESVQKVAAPQEIGDMKRRLYDVERKVSQAIILQTPTQDADTQEQTSEEVPEYEVSDTESGVVTEIGLSDITSSTAELTGSTTEIIPVDLSDVIDVEMPKAPDQELEESLEGESAIDLLRTALTDIQKLIIFMTNIDIRQNVSIETLVPVTPTIEEETDAVIEELDTVLQIQSDIEGRIDAEISDEKALQGTEILSGQVDTVSKLLEEGNIVGAQEMVIQAHAIAEDVQKMVSHQPLKAESPILITEDNEEESPAPGEVIEEVSREPEELQIIENTI
jgi:soluble cytochrome b562